MAEERGVGLKGWLSGPRHKKAKIEAEGATGLDKHRIAVLPLSNISPDPNDSYLAEGMTEEIISTLSGLSGLSVVARTSVTGYKGTTKKIKEIAKELDAGSILEGSFRKAGSKIRVTTQLIDIGSDRHIWSQSYDREFDDVFAVQTDIAKKVADALRIRLLVEEIDRIKRRPTVSPEAYSLYLRGKHHLNRRSIEDLTKANELFEQSIGEDPSFALGYVGLADACELLADWDRDILKNREKARNGVAKALELDNRLAEAHASQGLMLLDDFNLRAAEQEFLRALELKPSYANAHQWYFHLLLIELRWDEALEQIEKAVELDPLSQIINLNHASYYEEKRDYPKALELLKKAVELDPNLSIPHFVLSRVYYKMKMIEDGRREAKMGFELRQMAVPNPKRNEAMVAYWENNKEKVMSVLPQLEASIGEPMIDAFLVSGLNFYLGNIEKGFEWLERSHSNRDSDLLGIQTSAFFDSVRKDPRYLGLLRRLGFA